MNEELTNEMRDAIFAGNLDRIKSLVGKNKNLINAVTDFGSFLHDAAGNGKYEIVKYFIGNGFDVNLKAGFLDANALTEAASEGHADIVALLHESGAVLDTSTFAANPLFAAIYGGYPDVAKYLVDQGIDLAAAYRIGKIENCDALEYARQYGQTEIYDYIKERQNCSIRSTK